MADEQQPGSRYIERMAALIGQNYSQATGFRSSHSDTALASPDPCQLYGESFFNGINPTKYVDVAKMSIHELRFELRSARKELHNINQRHNVEELNYRRQVDNEIHDITEKVFVDATTRVTLAEMKRVKAEQKEKESKLTIDTLQEEIQALKALIERNSRSSTNSNIKKLLPSALTRRTKSDNSTSDGVEHSMSATSASNVILVDPTLNTEVSNWHNQHNMALSLSIPFIARIYCEDIDTTLDFPNAALVPKVRTACEENTLTIITNSLNEKISIKECALFCVANACAYQLVLDNNAAPLPISTLARNRIVAVCNLLQHLKYLRDGIIKSNLRDTYDRVMVLRFECAKARFGIPSSTAEMEKTATVDINDHR